jgi:hypothetical protein
MSSSPRSSAMRDSVESSESRVSSSHDLHSIVSFDLYHGPREPCGERTLLDNERLRLTPASQPLDYSKARQLSW